MKIRKSEAHAGLCAFFTLALVVLMITLLSLTVNREVGQKEIVVPYNTYRMRFGSEKEQGKYTTDVGEKWFRFKRNLQNLPLGRVECLSSDKIEIDLDVKLQIVMVKEALKRVVLRQFKGEEEHTAFLKQVTKSSIIKTCLNYTAEDYYSDRSGVDVAMFNSLQRDINDNDFGATVEFFQLESIWLPDDLINVIVEKQNVEQEVITATNDRENQLISANTELLEANEQAEVTIIEGNNTAVILRNRADQEQQIIATEWDNRAEAYASVVDSLDLDEKGLSDYLDSELLRQAKRVVV